MYVLVPSRWRGTLLGLLLAVVVSGLALAGSSAPAARPWRVLAQFHTFAAGAVLLILLALVARALLAMRGSKPERAPWLMLVVALGAAFALHATGSALAPGERGAEGLAHAAAALAPLPAPTPAVVLATHAVLLPLLLLGTLARVAARHTSAERARRKPAVLAAAGAVLLVAMLALALPVPEHVPEIRGIEAARAPWPLLALEPLESSLGVPLALGLLLLAFLALALAPMVAPPRLARRLAFALAATYLALTLAAGTAPPATHLAWGVGL